ncbi:MAG: hypothetical protein GYA55_05715 [SAR324 cluster bacterium]|uniref:Uncharacterized protein n=1 Tax=SAR324 cluster bacterium TaxID=2024889 RepID=A0A7X9FRR1_9DELT|nr:hypothetical protein [SAR324 cluster bacterium]
METFEDIGRSIEFADDVMAAARGTCEKSWEKLAGLLSWYSRQCQIFPDSINHLAVNPIPPDPSERASLKDLRRELDNWLLPNHLKLE